MRKQIALTALILFTASSVFAQNTFPTTGNVGIGTLKPLSPLTLNGGGTGMSLHPGGNPYFGTLAFNRESATGKIFDPKGFAYQINNGGPNKNLNFQVWSGDGGLVTGQALVIGTNGNIGIGTSSSPFALDIRGTDFQQLRLSGTNTLLKFANSAFNGGNGAELYQGNDGTFAFNLTSTQRILTINNAGNVGIGVGSPTHTLDVFGDSKIASTIITNSNSPLPNSSVLYSQSGFHNMFGVDGLFTTKYFGMKTDGNFTVMGGNVGIGTTTPVDALDVKGIFRITGANRNWRIMSHVDDGNLYFRDESNTAMVMTLAASGNVSIGTIVPKEALSVNGNIRAKEVKVETANWPDYVFEEGYQKETLSDLERYIKVNKHLPGIADAKTIAENGISISETIKAQQKIIEELTLHLIEQGKEIAELKKQVRKK